MSLLAGEGMLPSEFNNIIRWYHSFFKLLQGQVPQGLCECLQLQVEIKGRALQIKLNREFLKGV